MTSKHSQSGFALVEGLLILVIVGLLTLVGLKVYNTKSNVDNQNQLSTSQSELTSKIPVSNAEPVANVSTSADLDKAQTTLDKENPDDNSSDLNQLDSQLSTF